MSVYLDTPFFSRPESLRGVVQSLRTWLPENVWAEIEIEIDTNYPRGFMVRRIGRLRTPGQVAPVITTRTER